MTTTDQDQEQPAEEPIHVGGAVPAAEGAAPAPDLATLAQQVAALESRVGALEQHTSSSTRRKADD